MVLRVCSYSIDDDSKSKIDKTFNVHSNLKRFEIMMLIIVLQFVGSGYDKNKRKFSNKSEENNKNRKFYELNVCNQMCVF